MQVAYRTLKKIKGKSILYQSNLANPHFTQLDYLTDKSCEKWDEIWPWDPIWIVPISCSICSLAEQPDLSPFHALSRRASGADPRVPNTKVSFPPLCLFSSFLFLQDLETGCRKGNGETLSNSLTALHLLQYSLKGLCNRNGWQPLPSGAQFE